MANATGESDASPSTWRTDARIGQRRLSRPFLAKVSIEALALVDPLSANHHHVDLAKRFQNLRIVEIA